MEDLLETPEDYGCYIVDRRGQGVEESVNELVSLLSFTQTTDISFPLLFTYTCYGLRPKDLTFAPPPPPATCANNRPTNSSLSPTSLDDNVSTSETELNDYPNS